MRYVMPAFDTPRLSIRRLSDVDETLYCSLYTDADTMRHICEPLSQAGALRSFGMAIMLSDDAATAPQFLAVVERSTQHQVGICSIQSFDAAKRCAEVGMLLRHEARGHGYASEVIGSLVSQAFLALPIDVVWVQYHPANGAAVALLNRLRFPPRVEVDSRYSGFFVRSVHRSFWGSPTL